MKDEILALENKAMERWRIGDTGGLSRLAADDILYIDPGLTRPIDNLIDFKVYMRRIQGQNHYQLSEFIDPRVEIIGDAALLTYNYRSTELSVERTAIVQTPWNCTEIYFRRSDRWQIVHRHWSFSRQKLPQSLEISLPIQMEPVQYDGMLGTLMTIESAAMDRWRKGDVRGFFDLYTADFTYFDVGTAHRINGQKAMKEELDLRQGKVHYEVMEFIEPQVRVLGDLAVLAYRFLSTRLNRDGSVASRTPWNCTEVYIRRGGQWRILHNHWSYIRGSRE